MTKEQILKEYFSAMGRKGGSVKGPQKSRNMGREHYEIVAQAQRRRWAEWRLENGRPAIDRER